MEKDLQVPCNEKLYRYAQMKDMEGNVVVDNSALDDLLFASPYMCKTGQWLRLQSKKYAGEMQIRNAYLLNQLTLSLWLQLWSIFGSIKVQRLDSLHDLLRLTRSPSDAFGKQPSRFYYADTEINVAVFDASHATL
ncbi:hypothetical protein FRX31_022241 [Thalictrum thalictroides]|uniref:Uncharacterized protein n=1 Tax=Thalictrum thalictroides TaxID=46969 RepID=A0A7J6VSV6_THATH|nr:hypothetical protein FRX31_022241 [Thalictrum thalictroides]